MSMDHVSYVLAAGVAGDAAIEWTKHLPEPNLQELVYIVTIVWFTVQTVNMIKNWFKKDKE